MKHFFYILILISFVGCNSVDRPTKPENLITKAKMSDIMYDLYILNAAKGVNRKLLELNGIMPVDYIYKKHGIDSLQFAQSNTYYAYDTETYSALIDKTEARLQKEKDVYEKLNNEDQKKSDAEKAANKKKAKDSLKVFEESQPN
ncbi:DUF4296 domain-containing protein [Gelidibacter mesophilus]|uniref:DUF4296 domain-containing protein n=1 Tax=Gelidibacter mesophilus TaxID=169050 RepID=UPI0003F7EFE8|nr:DUF4296 domain-containing protein [Gelidibacter mesophilus]